MAATDYFALAGLAATALGAIASADAQFRQGQVAQQIGQYNASILNQQAGQALAESQARADILARESARKIGATKAAYGASGVDVGQGTPLDVLADQATEAELQKQLALYQGKTTALAYQQRAALSLYGGQAAEDAANLGAGTTLLTGGARVASGAYNLYGGKGTVPTTVPSIGPGTGYTY